MDKISSHKKSAHKQDDRKQLAIRVEIPGYRYGAQYRNFSVPVNWTTDDMNEHMRIHPTKIG
jgi:hypothetical protein